MYKTSKKNKTPEGFALSWKLLRRPDCFLSLGFGCGLAPFAPGTVASLFAWGLFLCVNPWLNAISWIVILSLGFVLGVWACKISSAAFMHEDHPAIVWDEIWAFCFLLASLQPQNWQMQTLAFLGFRIFDIWKPFPIAYLEKKMKVPGWRGAFGIMLDDLLASLWVMLILFYLGLS